MAKRTYKSDVGAIPKIVDNFKPKTLNQRVFHDIISDDDTQLVLCHGIAGTGKTYVSIYKALQDVLRRGTPYDKLIIINPTVDVGNEDKLGFLPGELSAKIQQYNESTFTILDKIIGKARAGKMIADNKIEIGVLNFLRGTNLENCYVILDEAQNTTPEQMKMFLTRLGFGSKMVITGDVTQTDLPNGQRSGLGVIKDILEGVDDISFMELTAEDVVRHRLIGDIVKAYGKYDATKSAPRTLRSN